MEKKIYNLSEAGQNSFAIVFYTHNAMFDCNKTCKEIKAYWDDACNGDYKHLVEVSEKMIMELNSLQLELV